MPFDASIRAIPDSVRTNKTTSVPLIPLADVGDVVVAPRVFRHAALTVDASDVAVKTLASSNVIVAGQDLEGMLSQGETDRLVPSGLTDANFSIGAVTSDKLGAPVPVYLGGTGVDTSGGYEGMVAVGTGGGALGFDPGFTWSNDGSTLNVASAANLDEFSVASSNGSLVLSGPGVAIDLLDYVLGIPPTATVSEPQPGSSDSNAVLDYVVADGDSDPLYLHISWYAAADDQPRLPSEVAGGVGAMSNDVIDLTSGQLSGSYTVRGLDPITEYVVRATAEDKRGNLSGVHPITVRTTEFVPPSVTGIHSYVTSAAQVGFSASNAPDASDMLLVAGLLTTDAPALTEPDVDANIGLFHTQTIEANTHSDVALLFSTAHDPSNSFAAEAVAEDRTYYPFVFYRDAESNAVLQYGDPLYNPDVTAPVFDIDAPLAFVSATTTTITVSKTISDAVGVTSARAYVSLLDGSLDPVTVPSVSDVLTHGQAISATGQSELTEYHSPDNAAKPLVDTAKYRVYVAAADAAGLTASQNIDVSTLDGQQPVFNSFAVASEPGTSNAVVTWTASDPGPHGEVSAVHVYSTSDDLVLTPEQVRSLATESFALASSSAVFDNVPAYYDTRIYAAAEDVAAAFGNPANLLSAVSQGAITVPVVTAPAFSQAVDNNTIETSAVVDGIDAQSGPVTVRLVLFNASDPSPSLTPAESNAVFSDTEPSAVLNNLVFTTEHAAEEVVA